ncbi:MAG: hypothetical protein JJU31_10580 [Wenzhouxiangella sp.]|nr:hypothetical protein [Wenzhouxiangella sp.]MCH8477916.1 hypothetical protein [Wenzhouxiangella sp.]
MINRFNGLVAPLAAGILILGGCASRETTPTLADEMRSTAAGIQAEADQFAELADQWDQGQKLIASGERKVDRGQRRITSAQRDLERGQREVAEGEEEISEGRRLVSESERKLEQLRRQQQLSEQRTGE